MEILFLSSKYYLYKQELTDSIKGSLEQEAVMIERYVLKESVDTFPEIFSGVKRRITIIERDGKVVYDSKKEGKEFEMDSHRYREEVKDSLSSGKGFAIRESRTIGKLFVYFTKMASDKSYIIRLSDEYDGTIAIARFILKRDLIFLLLLNLVLLVAYFIYLKEHFITRLKKMSSILNSGEESEIYLDDDDILKELWETIKMGKCKNMEMSTELDLERDKLIEIIGTIDIGIIVLSEDGEIVLTNDFVRSNICSESKKIVYYEKINQVSVIKFINKLRTNKNHIKEDFYISDIQKHFLIEGKYLEKRGIYIISLKDITRNRELNELQKKFITNVSHELKTPLTNIKGYLIALEDEEEKVAQDNFLKIINSNVDKIENMIGDFLNISKIESSKVLNIYPVSAESLFDNIEMELDVLIKKKRAKIVRDIDVKDSGGYLLIDYEKIFTIIKNLVENGVVYNKWEEPKVEIGVKESSNNYLFTVKDNGIGLENGDKERVFERFYRVDEARSSNSSGTGLGLSIVDELVKLCGGSIEVSSEFGEGTTIEVLIKK